MRKYIIAILTAAAGIAVLTAPDETSSAVAGAVHTCLEVVVPSLFAFTVLSIYLQRSGLMGIVLKPVTLPLSKLLRMNEELCGILVMSNIGGYPVGAKMLCGAVKSGRMSSEDAGRMLCCCFGSGPSFVIGIVGRRVFGSTLVGVLIFLACFISQIIMAVWIRRGGEIRYTSADKTTDISAQSFISSVTDGARVMYTVCVMITGFAVVSSLIERFGSFWVTERPLPLAEGIFPALLEVTQIKNIPHIGWWSASLCAGLLSFGGVCVIMQVMAIAEGIPTKAFLRARIFSSLLSAILALPVGMLPLSTEQTMVQNVSVQPFTESALMSLCVLGMCAVLLADEKPSMALRKSR